MGSCSRTGDPEDKTNLCFPVNQSQYLNVSFFPLNQPRWRINKDVLHASPASIVRVVKKLFACSNQDSMESLEMLVKLHSLPALL